MQIQSIQNKIHEVRGQKVMLDFDLSEMYEVETRVLNQAVKRNLESFPEDFMFKMSADEWKIMSSQFVMSSLKYRGAAYTPYAFTEHGVTMLASVLKSPKARQMNIAIVRAFIALRKLIMQPKSFSEQLQELRQELSQRLNEHDTQLNSIYDALENMLDKKADEKAAEINWKNRERIGFKK